MALFFSFSVIEFESLVPFRVASDSKTPNCFLWITPEDCFLIGRFPGGPLTGRVNDSWNLTAPAACARHISASSVLHFSVSSKWPQHLRSLRTCLSCHAYVRLSLCGKSGKIQTETENVCSQENAMMLQTEKYYDMRLPYHVESYKWSSWPSSPCVDVLLGKALNPRKPLISWCLILCWYEILYRPSRRGVYISTD